MERHVSLNHHRRVDYYFVLSDGNGIKVYGDDDGFYARVRYRSGSGDLPMIWWSTRPGFETPDWMKDAVIYQIFPDRSSTPDDESNNMAQLLGRGEVDYEYISDWYTLPKIPSRRVFRIRKFTKPPAPSLAMANGPMKSMAAI